MRIVFLILVGIVNIGCWPVTLADKPASNYFEEEQQLNLILAIENEEQDKISEFAKNGMSFDFQGREKVTPLLWAMHGQKWNSVKYLLDNGASPNYISYDDESTMVWAARARNSRGLKLLLEYGGYPDTIDKNEKSILYLTIENRLWKNMNVLIKAKANLDLGAHHALPMQKLIHYGKYEYVLQLLNLGADYKKLNNFGVSLPHTLTNRADKQIEESKKVHQWLARKGVRLPFPNSPPTANTFEKGYKEVMAHYHSFIGKYNEMYSCFIGERKCTEEENLWYENYAKEFKRKYPSHKFHTSE
jgi:uncharacterized protein